MHKDTQIIWKTDKKTSELKKVIKFYSQNFQQSIKYMVTSILSPQGIVVVSIDKLEVMKLFV